MGSVRLTFFRSVLPVSRWLFSGQSGIEPSARREELRCGIVLREIDVTSLDVSQAVTSLSDAAGRLFFVLQKLVSPSHNWFGLPSGSILGVYVGALSRILAAGRRCSHDFHFELHRQFL